MIVNRYKYTGRSADLAHDPQKRRRSSDHIAFKRRKLRQRVKALCGTQVGVQFYFLAQVQRAELGLLPSFAKSKCLLITSF